MAQATSVYETRTNGTSSHTAFSENVQGPFHNTTGTMQESTALVMIVVKYSYTSTNQ